MSKNDELLTFEEAYRILNYDCFTGEIRWSGNRSDLDYMSKQNIDKHLGKHARRVDGNGYIKIQIKGKNYKAHRLAWLMTYEKWPDGEVDHIDGNGLNNRIENLRDVTKSQNQRNRRINKASTTGVTGVCFHKVKKKYEVSIKSNGRQVYVGAFKTIEEAAAARKAANEQYGYHPLHGTVKNG
jgi:hypothetical protein